MYVPLAFLQPLRHGAVRFHRGSPVRSACVAALKMLGRSHRVSDLPEIRPADRPDLSFEPVDSMVMDAVYWLGVQGYEGIMARIWEDFCRQSRNILEVGGNVGLFTVLGGKATKGRYTVLEPLPEVAAMLRRNLSRNGIIFVEVIEAAAVPTDEMTIEINVPNEGRAAPVGAHLIGASEVAQRSSFRIVKTAAAPILGLVEGRDLIKIDAEGAEADLLTAATPTLARKRPTLVLEVLPESRRLAEWVSRFAASNDYALDVIPEYGSDTPVTVDARSFTADLPSQHRSKDIVLRPN